MHLSLYRRHRPSLFAEVAAQDAAVDLLRREIEKGKNSHAYLFSGPRGCGKTTLARIVAKALNCTSRRNDGEPCGECSSCVSIASGSSLDVVEIDGASNRGIDEIRELKEHISLSPFSGRFKVYIIDEVHMLTDAAFNALLKTLEEPPHTVVFILATTEPHKVPATIRSRCQHIPFHRIPVGAVVDCLESISAKEGAVLDRDALWEIARESDGSLRDALSLLEQALSTGLAEISLEDIRGILGGGGRSDLEKLLPFLREGKPEVLGMLGNMLERGLNSERFVEGMFLIFRDLLVSSRWKDEGIKALPLSEAEKDFVRGESAEWKESELWRILEFCTRMLPRARYGMKSEIAFGMFLGLFSSEEKRAEEPFPPLDSHPGVLKTGGADPVSPRPSSADAPVAAPKPVQVYGESLDGPWNECLEAISDENITLYCACISAGAEKRGDVVTVVFPEEFRFGYEIASQPRNLACLDSKRTVFFQGMEMRLVCGGRNVPVLSTAGDREAPGDPSATLFTDRAPLREDGAPVETEETTRGQGDPLAEIQRCFNADLLLLKDESPDGAEIPEGAPSE